MANPCYGCQRKEVVTMKVTTSFTFTVFGGLGALLLLSISKIRTLGICHVL